MHILTRDASSNDEAPSYYCVDLDAELVKRIQTCIAWLKIHNPFGSVRLRYGHIVAYEGDVDERFPAGTGDALDEAYDEGALEVDSKLADKSSCGEGVLSTECDGIEVWVDSLRVVGYRKHMDFSLSSDDFMQAVNHLIHPENL